LSYLSLREPQPNVSYEGMIKDKTSETERISLGNGHHIEVPVTTFIESLTYYTNPLFTDPLFPPLIDPPFTIFSYAYYSYYLPPSSTTTQSFGVNPSSFGFPEGLGNLSFSTTPVVGIVGASSLPETSMTQVTPNKPLARTPSIAHGPGNIPASLFPHMHIPSSLLGRSLNQMTDSQVIHTTTVTQATHPSFEPSQISKPYIGDKYSMGGQPSVGGKPSAAEKLFIGGQPSWLQHQPIWG
jgi:hypothetical protein